MINYILVNSQMSKEEIIEHFGKVSFAYSEKLDNTYKLVAIAKVEPQYLKVRLLMDKVDFFGTGTTMDIKYVPEIL